MLETAELRAPFAKEAAICSRRKAVCAEGGPSLSTCVPKSDKLKVAPRDGRSICCTPEILKLESRPTVGTSMPCALGMMPESRMIRPTTLGKLYDKRVRERATRSVRVSRSWDR